MKKYLLLLLVSTTAIAEEPTLEQKAYADELIAYSIEHAADCIEMNVDDVDRCIRFNIYMRSGREKLKEAGEPVSKESWAGLTLSKYFNSMYDYQEAMLMFSAKCYVEDIPHSRCYDLHNFIKAYPVRVNYEGWY